jgi:SM-20-related protein
MSALPDDQAINHASRLLKSLANYSEFSNFDALGALMQPHIDFRHLTQPHSMIASQLADRGVSIVPNAIPSELGMALWREVTELDDAQFQAAKIGRQQRKQHNRFTRTGSICWIHGTSAPCIAWLAWTESLRQTLNRELFMGLFSFESHYAHYRPGDFYKWHLDAFQGEANRLVSVVLYLNPGWQPDDGGELVLYPRDSEIHEPIKVTPSFGTLVCFLSEEFPHEVLPAKRQRYSIAGWFRVNTSTASRVDPPR